MQIYSYNNNKYNETVTTVEREAWSKLSQKRKKLIGWWPIEEKVSEKVSGKVLDVVDNSADISADISSDTISSGSDE